MVARLDLYDGMGTTSLLVTPHYLPCGQRILRLLLVADISPFHFPERSLEENPTSFYSLSIPLRPFPTPFSSTIRTSSSWTSTHSVCPANDGSLTETYLMHPVIPMTSPWQGTKDSTLNEDLVKRIFLTASPSVSRKTFLQTLDAGFPGIAEVNEIELCVPPKDSSTTLAEFTMV